MWHCVSIGHCCCCCCELSTLVEFELLLELVARSVLMSIVELGVNLLGLLELGYKSLWVYLASASGLGKVITGMFGQVRGNSFVVRVLLVVIFQVGQVDRLSCLCLRFRCRI